MKQRQRSFEEIMDVYAIKIIVDTPENCYRTIGHIHSLYKPVEGRFKDYIAILNQMVINLFIRVWLA